MKRVDKFKEGRRLANKAKYEGLKVETKTGVFEVVEYTNNETVRIRFINTGYEKTVWLKHITSGNVRDCTAPTLYGVGVLGETEFKTKGKEAKEYILWRNMLERCYCQKIKDKHPSYEFATTSEDFKHFGKFISWCSNQIGYGCVDDKGRFFHLDKDILVKNNKTYSEETCVFIPQEVNALFTHRRTNKGNCPVGVNFNRSKGRYEAYVSVGTNKARRHLGTFKTPEEAFYAYKEVKEQHIKDVANKWKDQIDLRAYKALMNYQVEITD